MASSKPRLATTHEAESPSVARKMRYNKADTEAAENIFRIEDGSETSKAVDRAALMGNILLENPEIETRWYFKFFLGQTHKNYVASLADAHGGGSEEVLLSILVDDTGEISIRAILWRKSGSERLLTRIPKGKPVDPKKIISEFGHGTPDRRLLEIKDPSVQNDLLVLEEQEGFVHCKFGVLFGKKGQITDDDMFSNENGSDNFSRFYASLGSVRPQKGFQGFRGGLDVSNGSTGEELVHTTEFGKEIVFHVSTLLPYNKRNRQQLERKRHIGNDICVIVYQEDSDTEFHPDNMRSKYTHIYAVVSPVGSNSYSLKVYTKNTVPEYGPPLPNPAYFVTLDELRHFLLVKLLNGEKSTLRSPTSSFAVKKSRTLGALINSIHERFDRKRTLGRGSPSSKNGRLRRLEDFRSQGQSIKMTKIASGFAPTSKRTTLGSMEQGVEPWTPICITSKLMQHVVAGDSWDGDFVGSSQFGLSRFFVQTHMSGKLESQLLIDSSISIVQVTCDTASGMMYFRSSSSLDELDGESGRGGAVYAAALDEFYHRDSPGTKKTMKKYIVPSTKNAHLFAVVGESNPRSPTAGLKSDGKPICQLAVAVGKKIRTYQFIPKNPARVPGMGNGGSLIYLQEFQCSDVVDTMSLGFASSGFRSGQSGQYICCAVRSGDFALIHLDTGAITPLPLSARAAVDPVTCLQVPDPIDDAQQEYVLCYNKAVEFKHANGHNSRQYEVTFSSRPHAIAYVYPYLLGFMPNAIEVITMINGSLVKTLTMARCRFLANKRGIFFTCNVDGQTMLYKMSEEALSGKSSVEREMGELPPQVAPGNVFVRRLSKSANKSSFKASPLKSGTRANMGSDPLGFY